MRDLVFDVVVIGGGINGAGIARDLAMRGVKIALFEKEDFGWATTWSSSSLIHGGARYIIHDIGVTKKSSEEAGILTKICPYMLSRRPFLIVIAKRKWLTLFDVYMSVYDLFSRLRYSMKHMRLSQSEVAEITGGEVIAKAGGILIEEYAVDPQRLSLVNILSAKENGAEVFNHTQVIAIEKKGENEKEKGMNVEKDKNQKKDDWKFSLKVKDLSGKEFNVKAKIVINASGPWVDKVINQLGSSNQRRKLRPTKGIHIVFPGKLLNVVLSFRAIDGRYLLFVPLEDRTILGTTDDDFFGDPDELDITRDEVEYLLHSAEKFIPRIRYFKPFSCKVGLRPTPYVYGVNEDKVTREAEIHDDDDFISVLGGKLASFRLLSEIVSDYVCRKIGINAKCKTKDIPLPGAEGLDNFKDFEETNHRIIEKIRDTVGEKMAYFLAKKYGMRAIELVRRMGNKIDVICECAGVSEGEVLWAIDKEMAETIDDIARRTWACDNLCNGIKCAKKIERILVEKGKNPQTEKFIERRENLLYPIRQYNMDLWMKFQEFKKEMLRSKLQ